MRVIGKIKQIGHTPKTADEKASYEKCPYCMSEIPYDATRCPHCTSIFLIGVKYEKENLRRLFLLL
ncbi:MAG: hypothetical protein L6V93_14370 [Clostridiales bacterium]|nr:MAG: hypothetical protein L6V93_14370 [Clostridiales bacterium]